MLPHVPACLRALSSLEPGQIVRVSSETSGALQPFFVELILSSKPLRSGHCPETLFLKYVSFSGIERR
jgi:hypothetical protein